MKYLSTRDSGLRIDAAAAILQGLSAEGGLFVPEELPVVGADFLTGWEKRTYAERASEILSLFLTDFTREEIDACTSAAYSPDKFGGPEIIGMVHLSEGTHLLELWRGPTCAFKDMALQILPRLLTAAARKQGSDKEIVILVATSGDTGKAALEGFCDVPGTRIIVFYPEQGVSPMQKRQMTTQRGKNVCVCAIQGNFDDAQTAVKSIFTDAALAKQMAADGKRFSSANSINWGRLLPQIVYYFSAYSQLCAEGGLQQGEAVNICVPTGNFGNILAAYYAKRMGLPVGKLICASNENRVLADFIRTGCYDCRREFHATLSPSMDILISSNLERLLFELSGRDSAQVGAWYRSLSETGKFTVSSAVRERLAEEFFGGWCGDEETKATIRETFTAESYLCDPHTAVAVRVLADYRKETGDLRPAILASTANPYKFGTSVLSSLTTPRTADEYAQIRELYEITGMEVPPQLTALRDEPVRFTGSVQRDAIRDEVIRMLNAQLL